MTNEKTHQKAGDDGAQCKHRLGPPQALRIRLTLNGPEEQAKDALDDKKRLRHAPLLQPTSNLRGSGRRFLALSRAGGTARPDGPHRAGWGCKVR